MIPPRNPPERREGVLDRPHVQLALVLLFATALWLTFRAYTGIVLEDALITWRHSSNLVAGHGLVFNAGERVLGTTAPLQAVIIAAIGFVFGSGAIPIGCLIAMVLCALGGLACGYEALRRGGIEHRSSLVAVSLAAVHPTVVWSTVGGMETPLVWCLMMGSLLASLTDRYVVVGLACALLIMTRPDGAIWVALIAVHALWRGRQAALRRGVWGLLLLITWAAYATAFYGSPLPHSVTAKQVIGNAGAFDLQYLSGSMRWLLAACGVDAANGVTGTVAHGVWILCLLAGAARILGGGAGSALWPLVVFPVALSTALVLGHAPQYFPWYLVPSTFCLCIVGALGVSHLVSRSSSGAAASPKWINPQRVVAFTAVLLIVMDVANGIRRSARVQERNQANEVQTRQRIGEWLASNTPSTSTVAMEAIGYQGTYSNRHIIDLAGLISPAVVELHKGSRTNAEAFGKILRELRPDYLVLRSFEVTENRHLSGGVLFETPEDAERFWSVYERVREFTAPYREVWGERSAITIYARRGTQEVGLVTGPAR